MCLKIISLYQMVRKTFRATKQNVYILSIDMRQIWLLSNNEGLGKNPQKKAALHPSNLYKLLAASWLN